MNVCSAGKKHDAAAALVGTKVLDICPIQYDGRRIVYKSVNMRIRHSERLVDKA